MSLVSTASGKLTGAVLAAAMLFTPGAATAAMPQIAPVPAVATEAAPIVQVQRRFPRRRAYNRGFRAGRNSVIRRNRGFRNRYYRPRYNRGAAIAGGVIGGLALGAIIANSQRPVYRDRVVVRRSNGFSAAHHGWCSARYRSYRSYDGTFQPYHGPRKLCRSPYL